MEKNRKITAEDILESHRELLIESLFDGSLELNDCFIRTYCNEEIQSILIPLSEDTRAIVLDGTIKDSWFNGSIPGDVYHCLIPCEEIEYQFEGIPEDVFEDPGDFTIRGNLAYLYTGYGFSIEFDIDSINRNIKLYIPE